MKIGIITIYESITNMGSFLQAYAMKTALEGLGHEVLFVQNVPMMQAVKKCVLKLNPKRELLLRYKKALHFTRDMKKLQLVPKACIEQQKFDILIYGSDEIWNLDNPYFREDVFWGIDQKEIKKVAYAISIGCMERKTEAEYAAYFEEIPNFQSILVRDERTRSFIERKTGKNPRFVCDPTILVPVSKLTKQIRCSKEKYLLVYTYGLDRDMEKLVVSFARKNGLKIVSPCFWHLWADKVIECSALELSSWMAGAEYVFTTTFHGAIFSLLNHKKCCIYPVREKVSDVVMRLGETHRLIETDCSYEAFSETMNIPFDDGEFEKRMEQWRAESIELLKGALQ